MFSIPARDSLSESMPITELAIEPPLSGPILFGPPPLCDWLLGDSEYESSPATSRTSLKFFSSSIVDCLIIPEFPPTVVVLLTVISAPPSLNVV